MRNKIIVIFGPSGSGKSTLGKHLEEIGVHKMITNTSRAPRKGEVQDVDYHFKTREEFEEGVERGEYLEYTCYGGNYYGTSIKDVEKALTSNQSYYTILDAEGLKVMKKKFGDRCLSIFLTADKKVLRQRMVDRGDKLEDVESRLSIVNDDNRNSKYADYTIVSIDEKTTNDAIDKILEEVH